ncbi:hypothetical protein ACFYO2_11905 [Streptomyces sp. NPDC006602]|uniref:hypothetical protein n=1 Tax=Streptomyces sp. NPDC006602 TaxID=3364751 RepID=UPI00369F7F11
MTLQAVLSGAALRVMRTAAGRRALQLAVLVGGLFALGFLCGGQAQAADGVLAVTSASSVTATTSTAATTLTTSTATTASATSTASATRAASGDVLSSDSAQVVRSVDTRVAQPVGRLVGTVTTGLAEAEAKLPSLPESSEVPSLPGISDLPGLSEVLDQPGLPGLPDTPGLPALPGQTLPAPVASVPPQSSSPTTPSVTKEQDTQGRSTAAMPLMYGPRFVVGAAVSGDVAHTSAHRSAPAEQAPVRHAPPGDPRGVLVGKSAVDNGTPRHGDAHAVTHDKRAPLRLVAGVVARAAADGTRDRHRDIPVFPG